MKELALLLVFDRFARCAQQEYAHRTILDLQRHHLPPGVSDADWNALFTYLAIEAEVVGPGFLTLTGADIAAIAMMMAEFTIDGALGFGSPSAGIRS